VFRTSDEKLALVFDVGKYSLRRRRVVVDIYRAATLAR